MATLPQWAAPRMPFQDVLAGTRKRATNPGGAFNASQPMPSIQRFNRLMPSEQQGYTGYLEDELQVDSNDVYGMMQRLAPKGAGMFSQRPRWLG